MRRARRRFDRRRRVIDFSHIASDRRVFLDPPAVVRSTQIAAIREADAIVLGPARCSRRFCRTCWCAACPRDRQSHAVKVYVCNVMTQPGETDGMTAGDHVRVRWITLANKSQLRGGRQRSGLAFAGRLCARGKFPWFPFRPHRPVAKTAPKLAMRSKSGTTGTCPSSA